MRGRRAELVGSKFGSLLVMEAAGSDRHHRALFKCLCDCGKETTVAAANLKSGGTVSCGCSIRKRGIDLEGTTSGFLSYVPGKDTFEKGQRMIQALCACGNEIKISVSNYIEGAVKSCGCWRRSRPQGRMDLKDCVFGRWTVVDRVKKDDQGTSRAARWLCRCVCGTERVILRSNLITGQSTSCGCSNPRNSGKRDAS